MCLKASDNSDNYLPNTPYLDPILSMPYLTSCATQSRFATRAKNQNGQATPPPGLMNSAYQTSCLNSRAASANGELGQCLAELWSITLLCKLLLTTNQCGFTVLLSGPFIMFSFIGCPVGWIL